MWNFSTPIGLSLIFWYSLKKKIVVMKKAIYKVLDAITFRCGVRGQVSGMQISLPLRYHSFTPSNYESDNSNFLQTKNIQPSYKDKMCKLIDKGHYISETV